MTDKSNDSITLVKGGEGTVSASVTLNGTKNKNETATVTIVVSNPHDFDVTLETLIFTRDQNKNEAGVEYITIEHSFVEGTEIKAGQTYSFTVTATCNATSANAVTENFAMQFKAVSQ